MMDETLPAWLPAAEVLITVKTYPLPLTSFGEVVCTAGLLSSGHWVRIYPIPFRAEDYRLFSKYQWIRLDLKKKSSDFRPETYSPAGKYELLGFLDTKDRWRRRKSVVLGNVYTSLPNLLEDSHGEKRVSLAALKPSQVIDFSWKEVERDWPENWKKRLRQMNLFSDIDSKSIVRKVPYEFYYTFRTEDDSSTHRLMITDWEVGALYWNCLARHGGNETAALNDVRAKYYHSFCEKRDLFFFLGTNYESHYRRFGNPFMIVGVFYPPRATDGQLRLDL